MTVITSQGDGNQEDLATLRQRYAASLDTLQKRIGNQVASLNRLLENPLAAAEIAQLHLLLSEAQGRIAELEEELRTYKNTSSGAATIEYSQTYPKRGDDAPDATVVGYVEEVNAVWVPPTRDPHGPSLKPR